MISISARYAIAALVHLAEDADRTMLNAQVSRATGVSPDYLSKIMQTLRRSGFIRTRRGRGGGLALSKNAEEVTLYEIVRAIDGESAFQACLMANRTCGESAHCDLHRKWSPVRENMIEFFRSTTLAEVTG